MPCATETPWKCTNLLTTNLPIPFWIQRNLPFLMFTRTLDFLSSLTSKSSNFSFTAYLVSSLNSFLQCSGAELLTGLVLKTKLATFLTFTMTSSNTFHLDPPPTFKASTTDAFTSIPCLVCYRTPYLLTTLSSLPMKTSLFTMRRPYLNLKGGVSSPTFSVFPTLLNPSSLQKFAHCLAMAMLSPSSTTMLKEGNMPSEVISWIFHTTWKKLKWVLSITSFPAKTVLTFISDLKHLSSCNYLILHQSTYHFNTLLFIYVHLDSFKFDFCSRYRTLQNILVLLVTYKLLAMKYALIPHLSPPVSRLSYAMLSSTSSIIGSKVYVAFPSVFMPLSIKPFFIGYSQLTEGKFNLRKASETLQRQPARPRLHLKSCQEMVKLTDEKIGFQNSQDPTDEDKNQVYTLSDYSFEDNDTIIVPVEDMDQVRTDILREQIHAFTIYKHVDQKIKPVSTMFPEEARVRRTILRDPLLSLVPLPIRPPEFNPMA